MNSNYTKKACLPNRQVLAIIILLTTHTLIFAQNRNIDSLENLLARQKEDTNKINILNDLGFEYLYIDTTKSAYYNKTASELADSLNYKKGVALSLSHTGHLVSLSGRYDEALNYYQKALAIFKETNDQTNTAICYTDIAIVYYYLSDYLKCIELNSLALKIADTLTDKKGIVYTYTSLGLSYIKLGNYPKALNYFFLALRICESLQDYKREADCYNNIAIIYKKQTDFDNSLKYFDIVIELHKKYNDIKGLASCYNNVGNVYIEINKNSEAIQFYNLALQIFKKLGFKYGIAATTNNIGEAYFNLKEYKAAKQFYEEALMICDEISDAEGISVILFNLSQLHLNLSDTKQAKFYAGKALKIATGIKSLPQMNAAYKLLSQIAGKENNFQEAYRYQGLYQISSDSLFNIEKTKEIENIKFSYELDKKDLEIQTLEYENNLKTVKISHQKKLHTIYLIVFVLSVIAITIILFQLRIKNIAYKFLVQKNLDLLSKEKELKNFKENITLSKLNKKRNITITDNLKEEILEKLEQLFDKEKIFKDFDLTIDKLAKSIQTNRNYLSQTIYKEFGKNYIDFINEYRVKEAMLLFSDPKKTSEFSIAGIANESGFRSVSKFNLAFKKFTGITPSNFRDKTKTL